MTDGHTAEGSYEVTLVLTADQVNQLTRLVELAKMIDGRDFKTSLRDERFDVLAYRAFLEEILVLLQQAVKDKPRPI